MDVWLGQARGDDTTSVGQVREGAEEVSANRHGKKVQLQTWPILCDVIHESLLLAHSCEMVGVPHQFRLPELPTETQT